MEKTLEKGRLPQIDSIEELARFWDTHDLTDFEVDLEEVTKPVFVRAKGRVVTVSLKANEAQRLKRIASSKGVKDTTLLRQWIIERLNEVSVLDRPHNTYEDSPGQETKIPPALKRGTTATKSANRKQRHR